MIRLRKKWLLDLICVVALLLFAVGIAYPRWRAWIDWRDEGLLAYGTVRVMEHQIPHRDFVSLQPPLSYYTSAIVFKILGTSLLSLRIFGLAIFFLLPLLIYAVGRNFMRPILCLAAAMPVTVLGMPYMRFVPFAVWQGIAASFGAALLFILATQKRPWLAFPSGCLIAVSLFLRHDQAVYTGIALLVWMFGRRFTGDDSRNLVRMLAFWVAGIAFVCAPLLIIWWRIGALPEMFRQLVIFPFATYRKTSSLPFPGLFAQKSFLDFATALLFYVPPLVQAVAAIYIVQSIFRRQYEFRHAVLTLLLVWSVLFFFQVLVRSDLTHVLMTLPPFFLLAAFGWSLVQEKIPGAKMSMVLSSILALIIALYLWRLRPVVPPDMSDQKELLNLRRGGVRVAQAAEIANFFQTLQQAVPPERSILVLPYQPLFYFLAERRNPTRWNYLWPGDQTDREHENLIEQAERDPPAIVVLAERQELAKFAPTIIEYVREQYIYTDSLGDIGIYVRRSAP